MITDTEIKERFVALIQREPFDYTKWRQGMDEELSIEEISKKAMALRKTLNLANLNKKSL